MYISPYRTLKQHGEMIAKVSELVASVKALDDAARSEFIDQLRREVCIHCGNDSLPCYCTRDD